MNKMLFLVATYVLFFVVACNNAPQETTGNTETHNENNGHDHADGHAHNHTSENTEVPKATFEGEKSKNLSMILDTYLTLKNALTNDDSQGSSDAAQKMLSAFMGFDKEALDEAKKGEYTEITESAVENAEHIVKNTNVIDHQREHFETLSIDINDLIALLGTEKVLYQDFCPMYNDGKGAIWISETKDIKNPYYGSKMLSCGKMQKEIK